MEQTVTYLIDSLNKSQRLTISLERRINDLVCVNKALMLTIGGYALYLYFKGKKEKKD